MTDCTFLRNENGILTSNRTDIELDIVNSEFGYNGNGDGLSHNLYVGEIARLSVTGSYFHHANGGHLLKSRAETNQIFYNRLTDESGGTASYELEFPNGGSAYVVGNIIQQSALTTNRRMVAYGAEGNRWPKNELYLAHNTLVDDRPREGVFLYIRPRNATVKALNNLLVGSGKFEGAADGEFRNNFTVGWDAFEQASREDYRLKRNSPLIGKAVDAGSAGSTGGEGQSPLQPKAEYVHPRATRVLNGNAQNPGALQQIRQN